MTPAACTPPEPPPPRRRLVAVPDGRAAWLGLVVERLRSRMEAGAVRPSDGMVWLAHVGGDGVPRLFSRVSDPVADLDELYLLDLLGTLHAIGLPRAMVAIWRDDGQPVAVDRRLTRDLLDRLTADSGTTLEAVVVVSPTGHRVVRAARRSQRVEPTGSAAAQPGGAPDEGEATP